MAVYSSSIAKKFKNYTTNVTLFLWCWLLKVAIQQYESIIVNALRYD